MVISPDSDIEKQKNEHTHNFERTAPKFVHFYLVRSIMHQGQTTAYGIQAKKQVLPVYQMEKALKPRDLNHLCTYPLYQSRYCYISSAYVKLLSSSPHNTRIDKTAFIMPPINAGITGVKVVEITLTIVVMTEGFPPPSSVLLPEAPASDFPAVPPIS